MTSSRPTSSWPTAVGWWFAGSLLTVITFIVSTSIGINVRGEAAGFVVQLLEAAGVGLAVCTAVRLPRRARAMFVAGVVTPIALGVAVLVWIIWAFSQSNFTF